MAVIIYLLVLAVISIWPLYEFWRIQKRRPLAAFLLVFQIYTYWDWFYGYFFSPESNENGSVLVYMFVALPIYIIFVTVLALLIYKYGYEIGYTKIKILINKRNLTK